MPTIFDGIDELIDLSLGVSKPFSFGVRLLVSIRLG